MIPNLVQLVRHYGGEHRPQAILARIARELHAPAAVCFCLSADRFSPVSVAGELERSASLREVVRSSPIVDALQKLEGPCSWDQFGRHIASTNSLSEADKCLMLAIKAGVVQAMKADDDLLGFLVLGSVRGGWLLDESCKTRLEELSTLMTLSLALHQLQRDVIRDLRAAKDVQENILSLTPPRVGGCDCAIEFVPASSVSGDFFDVVSLASNRMAFAVGDVSGKGISAALVMANIMTSLRREMLSKATNLPDLAAALHALVRDYAPKAIYATLFYGVLDLQHLVLRYFSAGHNPPALLLSRHSQPVVTVLDHGSSVLGLVEVPPEPHRSGAVNLHSGDCIIVATDGVVDARNSRGVLFDLERFVEAAEAAVLNATSAEEIAAHVRRSIAAFSEGMPQADDMTILAITIA